MPSSEAAGTGDGTTGTRPEMVLVTPIPEAEARDGARTIREIVTERDLNDDETETLIALTLMKVSGAMGLWEYDSKMRDLFLTAARRKNGHQRLW